MTDGSYIATGKTASYGPTFDPIFLKLNSIGTMAEGVGVYENALADNKINLYPNPSSGRVLLDAKGYNLQRIRITNSLGEEIFSEVLKKEEQIELDLENHPPGLYFMTCEMAGKAITKKLIIN
jgi:hypothetical protein